MTLWRMPSHGRPRGPPHLDHSGEHGHPRGHSGENPATSGPLSCSPPHGELLPPPQHCALAAALLLSLGDALLGASNYAALGKPFPERVPFGLQLSGWGQPDGVVEIVGRSPAHPAMHGGTRGHPGLHASFGQMGSDSCLGGTRGHRRWSR
jgi:hypothetical protein